MYSSLGFVEQMLNERNQDAGIEVWGSECAYMFECSDLLIVLFLGAPIKGSKWEIPSG